MALCELAKEHDDVLVLDADLAAATKTDIFKKAYPERFYDCGIAEGNMIGVAAGLAAAGMVPFAASFAMFATGRAYEQVRNSVGYPHLNVKIAGSHAGISVGEDGATHQCCEDLALMRTIPGMVILNPADHYEMIEVNLSDGTVTGSGSKGSSSADADVEALIQGDWVLQEVNTFHFENGTVSLSQNGEEMLSGEYTINYDTSEIDGVFHASDKDTKIHLPFEVKDGTLHIFNNNGEEMIHQ